MVDKMKETKVSPKKRNKALLILLVFCLIIGAGSKVYFDYTHRSDIAKKNLIIIEGEYLTGPNNVGPVARFYKNNKLLSGKSLEFSTPQEIAGGYYITYEFEVKKAGVYNITFCSTPPGPLAEGSKWHSPYSVSLDGQVGKQLSEESISEEWPQYMKYNYLEGGYFFNKVMSLYLDKGPHSITVNISQPRKHDGNFTFYIDAIMLSPEGFRSKTNIGRIPKELFYDL